MGRPGWKERYYARYFGARPFEDPAEYHAIRRKVAHDYFHGLQWNNAYYCKETRDWTWFWPHDAGPTLTDLADFFEDLNLIQLAKTKPLKPLSQLMAVLPPASARLLPTSYQLLMKSPTSPILFMYPIDFKLHTLGHCYFGECVARLPPVDADAIDACVKGKKLSKEERARNAVSKGTETLQCTSTEVAAEALVADVFGKN